MHDDASEACTSPSVTTPMEKRKRSQTRQVKNLPGRISPSRCAHHAAKRTRLLSLTPSPLPLAHRFAHAVTLTFSAGFALHKDVTSLLLVCTSSHSAVVSWLYNTFAADVSLGKEQCPVSVRLRSLDASRVAHTQLLSLLAFEYSVQCRYPIPRNHHALSPVAAATAQRSELAQRVMGCRRVRVTIATSAGRQSSIRDRSNHKGWCVYAEERIACGAFIGEYSGDLISTRQMRMRFAQQQSSDSMNFVLVLREVAAAEVIDSPFDALRTIVDATACGSFTRLINHSCDPNVVLAAVRVDSLIPRIVLFAKRDIARGEELSFDYAGDTETDTLAPLTTSLPPATTDVDARRNGAKDSNTMSKRKRTRCLCAAANCRGFLPSDASV